MQATRMERMDRVRDEVATLRAAMPPKPQSGFLSREAATGILADIAKCASAHHNSRVQAIKLLAELEGWLETKGPTIGLVVNLGASEKLL